MTTDEPKTILLVEDEAIIAIAEARTIKRFGYEVIIANSGGKAVEHAAENKNIALVLMDIDLGKGINGPDAAVQILEKRVLPIIFLTSHSEREMVEKVQGITRYGYVIKNSGDFVLQSSIEMAFELFETNRRLENELSERKRAEARLSHSQNLMQYVIEHNRSAVAVHDRDLKYVYVSQRYIQDYGVKEKDLIGKHHYDVFPDLPQKWRDVHQRALAGEVSSAEDDVYEREDGSVDWTRWECRPWYEADGSIGGIIVYTEVITERKRMEESLRASEAQFRVLFEKAVDGIIYISSTTELVDINESFAKMHGYTVEEMRTMKLQDLDVEDQSHAAAERMRRIENGELLQFEVKHYRKDRQIIDLEVSASIISVGKKRLFVAFHRDITERNRAEAMLRENEERFALAIKGTGAGLWDWDMVSDRVEFSPQWKKMLGYEVHEVEDAFSGWKNLWHPDDCASIEKSVEDYLAGKTDHYEIIHRLRHKDGEWRWILTRGDIVKDAQGKPVRWVGTNIDITERKRAEEAFQNVSEQFRSVLESSRDVIAMLDTEYRYILFNSAFHDEFKKIFGRDLKIGDSMPEALAAIPHDLTDALKHWKRALGGEDFIIEQQFGDAKLERNWYELHFSPIRDTDGKITGAVHIVRAITDRKHAEQALRESEKRFSSFMDYLPGIAFLKDSEGRTLFVNKYMDSALGASQWIGKNMVEVFPNPFGEKLIADDMRVMKLGYQKIEESIPHLDGTLHDYETQKFVINRPGQEPLLGGISLDITERKHAEEDLSESEEKFSAAFKTSPYAITITQAKDGLFIEVNDAFYSMTGFTREETRNNASIGMDLWVHLDDRNRVVKELMAGKEVVGQEFWFKKKNGEILIGLFSARLIHIKNGTYIISSINDITERKQAEAEIQKLNTELEQRVIRRTGQLEAANKELESFSFSVSHDLRAPLRGIDGWSLSLLEDYGSQLDATAQTYIRRVRSETQRMGQLIDDIQKLSRMTRTEMHRERVDLSAIAGTIAARLQETEKQRSVEFALQPELFADGDARLLEVLLTNLLDNSFKFTSKTADARIEFGKTESQGKRIFFIRDNGAGFDMAFANKLFGAFQRMHKISEFPGTGIGLATVQRIIHRHGGRVWAESHVDHGATFYFTLQEDQ